MNLFNTVREAVYKNSITYSILRLDKTIERDDLVNTVYLKVYDKDPTYTYRQVKQTLIDIYRKVKRDKNKLPTTNEYNIEDSLEYCCEDENAIPKEMLISLKDVMIKLKETDEETYVYVYEHFVKNISYRELGRIYQKSFRSVKWKVDKGIEFLKKNYKK